MEDIIERVVQVLKGVGISRIRSAEVGQSPLRRTKSVTISETCEGVWKAEEASCEEGVIVYVAIKYHDRGQDDLAESQKVEEEERDSGCDDKSQEPRTLLPETEDESLKSNELFDSSEKISHIEEENNSSPSAQGNLHDIF